MPRFRPRVLIAATAALVLAPALSAQAADNQPNNAVKVIADQFPDPGFLHASNGNYYAYATGGGFKVASSTTPMGTYGNQHKSMSSDPTWVGTAPDGGRHLWAPNVVEIADAGGPLFVMYFTGYNKNNGWNANCVGVATSRSPEGDFVQSGGPICALNNDHEAIDPTAFQDPATGKRWIVFKTNVGNVRDFRIQAIQMDTATGTTIVPNTRRTLVASDTEKMEAPSLIVREGRIWLFLARNNFSNCTYSTDARSTTSFESGTWSAPNTVMSQAGIGLCGPGGATVIQDTDGKAYIAFHAYRGKDPATGVRETWVGKLGWGSGVPILY